MRFFSRILAVFAAILVTASAAPYWPYYQPRPQSQAQIPYYNNDIIQTPNAQQVQPQSFQNFQPAQSAQSAQPVASSNNNQNQYLVNRGSTMYSPPRFSNNHIITAENYFVPQNTNFQQNFVGLFL